MGHLDLGLPNPTLLGGTMYSLTYHPSGMAVRCEFCGRALVGKELSPSAIQAWIDHHEDETLPFEQ